MIEPYEMRYCVERGIWMRVHKTQKEDTGRSMVEMLGVLAIMGLLSVVAVMGLRSAMDKNLANNLKDAISKNTAYVSGQLLMSASAELAVPEVSGHSLTLNIRDNRQFSITTDSIEAKICRLVMQDFSLPVRRVYSTEKEVTNDATKCEDGVMQFVFNDDLSSEPRGRTITCTADGDCGRPSDGCSVCVNGVCQNSTCSDGKTCMEGACVCADGRASCGTACCGEGEACISKPSLTCEAVDVDCVKNADCCAENADCERFCNIVYTEVEDAASAGTNEVSSASCDDKGEFVGSFTFNDHTFYMGNLELSFWAAANYCQAHGKNLASLSSLGLQSKNVSCVDDAWVCALQDARDSVDNKGVWIGRTPAYGIARAAYRLTAQQTGSGGVVSTYMYQSGVRALCE